MRRPRALVAAGLLLALLSCRGAGDPVSGAVDSLVRAANRRDRAAMLQRLTPDFRAADGSGRPDVEERLRQLFAAYDELHVSFSDLTIDRGADVALARFRLDLSGRASRVAGLEGLLPGSSRYRFELRLVPVGDRWNVAWARWEEERR